MATIQFYKYQGTGNDFVMIDDRREEFPYSASSAEEFDALIIQKLCDRRFGIGADGVILIRNHKELDFEMIYFNADGSQSLCGNGSRCAVMFARHLDIIGNETKFLAIDGPHEASIEGNNIVRLKMGNVDHVDYLGEQMFIDTGSPHYIEFVSALEHYNVFEKGGAIRHQPRFSPNGTNVNFVEPCGDNEIYVRTFERGVENETLSCGTGVTAASLAASYRGFTSPVKIKTKGGSLKVAFKRTNKESFKEIFLIGPAGMVFEGKVEI